MSQDAIVITGTLPPWAEQRLAQEFQLLHFDDTDQRAYARFETAGVVAVISRGALPVDAALIERCPDLKVIAKTGVGMDAIDVVTASRRGIPVLYTPCALSRSVAEHALMMILALLKRLPEWQSELRAGDWKSRYEQLSSDLTGRRVGIVGYGRIGSGLRALLRPFDCRINVCDPYLDASDYREDDVRFQELEGLLESSEIVSLHVPLTEETRGMIDKRQLDRLPAGALLINTARGAVIDSLDDLEAALRSGLLGGVGLDVFAAEPPPTGHPLFRHQRAVLTGHVASRSEHTQRRIIETTLQELSTVLAGRRPTRHNVVNPEVLQGLT